jgi:hypothetical protein
VAVVVVVVVVVVFFFGFSFVTSQNPFTNEVTTAFHVQGAQNPFGRDHV